MDGSGEVVSVWLQYGTVAGLAAAAYVSLAAAFAIGPGKEFLALRFLDEQIAASGNAYGASPSGRKLRRPNRAQLRDPEKRSNAIDSYRERAKAALASGRAPSSRALSVAFGRLALVLLLTIGLATFSFGAFISAHALLFKGGNGFEGLSTDFWRSVAVLVVEHVRSAFAFTSVGCPVGGAAFKLNGVAMEQASQLYRLAMAWSVPAIAQRGVGALSILFKRGKFDHELRRIADATDDELLLELAAYAEE